MSNPWGKIGAWAAEAERFEEEEREAAATATAAAAGGGDSQTFPSLREAATATTKQKKKTKMSLQEFYVSGRQEFGLTPAEMLHLPTGPKERSADEMQHGRLGGGFSGYGARSSGPSSLGRNRERDMDGEDSWSNNNNRRSYGGGFENDRRGPPSRVSDMDQPSRADEVDNWVRDKRTLPAFDSGRPSRSSDGGFGLGFSRADEVDNWARDKKTLPALDSGRPSRTSGGGFGLGPSRVEEVDNWFSLKKAIPQRPSNFVLGFGDGRVESDGWAKGGTRDGFSERPRLVLDPPKREGAVGEVVKSSNKPSPFGEARPREEVLAEKGLDWKKMDSEIEARKTSRPTSSQSSRPGSAHSSRSEGPALQGIEGGVKPRPKVNPFGDAKPREVLLGEKGLDWRKIDLALEHRSVDRPETEAEKNLKEYIEHLKRELEKESASCVKATLPGSGEGKISLHDLILQKERELELLVLELDNKVRFGQKAIERPGSGAGRVAGYPERPPSQPWVSEDSRGVQFVERPRSRGRGEAWTRQGDDRRGFQVGRDRGFLENRLMDRSSSRDRW